MLTILKSCHAISLTSRSVKVRKFGFVEKNLGVSDFRKIVAHQPVVGVVSKVERLVDAVGRLRRGLAPEYLDQGIPVPGNGDGLDNTRRLRDPLDLKRGPVASRAFIMSGEETVLWNAFDDQASIQPLGVGELDFVVGEVQGQLGLVQELSVAARAVKNDQPL